MLSRGGEKMAKIQLLDQHTINKIAAGEVVERPASVVKELVENAIDALSSAVTVEIKDGGTSYIRITDNGCGIPKDQVQTAFLRHSTSKIKDEYDLSQVGTLGFRGEALASIASVAKVEMMTKTRDDLTGIRIIIEGGAVVVEEEIGCPEGTTIIVRNLFYNTPARRKFLKSPATESTYISDLINRIALGHPEVAFKYINKGKTVLHTNGNSQLKSCIFNVYDKKTVKEMIEVEGHHDKVSMAGFVGRPVLTRGNRTYQSYYINGRYIKSKIIEKGILDAYKDFIPQGSYPYIVLHFDIAPETIDVNVHPTKMEVRFEESDGIYDLVKGTIHKALQQDNLIPDIDLSPKKTKKEPIKGYVPEAFEITNEKLSKASVPSKVAESAGQFQVHGTKPKPSNVVSAPVTQPIKVSESETTDQTLKETIKTTPQLPNPGSTNTESIKEVADITNLRAVNSHLPTEVIPVAQDSLNEQHNLEEQTTQHTDVKTDEKIATEIQQPTFSSDGPTEQVDMGLSKLSEVLQDFKLVGQVFKTYWIVEKEKKMYIVDQHAAHEKVLYEKFMDLKSGDKNSQVLLHPIVLNLSEQESLLLEKQLDLFLQFGFEIEDFGNNAYIVRGVPYLFNNAIDESFFLSMLDGLVGENQEMSKELMSEKIALMSCKAAVKGNNRLSYQEMEALMQQLFTLENPFNCPHGRPTIISLTQYELEKKFKRV